MKRERTRLQVMRCGAIALTALLCFGLVSCASTEPEQENAPVVESTPSLRVEPTPEQTPETVQTPPSADGNTAQNTESEWTREELSLLVNKYADCYVKSALWDEGTLLTPGMQFAALPKPYRGSLLLTDDAGRLVEGEPFRDMSVVRTYENDNVTIRTVAFLENAVLRDGSKPPDVGTEYILDIAVKSDRVTTFLFGLKLGDPSPFGSADRSGTFEYDGRPALQYTYENGVLTGMRAYRSGDLDTMRYNNLSALQFVYDENGCVVGSNLEITLPEYDATQELLGYVDELLAEKDFRIWCWLSRGSGPCSVSMNGHENAIRELLAGYRWQKVISKSTEGDGVWEPGDWNMWLGGDLSRKIFATTYGEYLDVSIWENESKSLTYTAEGVSELPLKLADLYPGPSIRFHLVDVPADTVKNEEEMAALWAEKFEQLYMESGHITDFELRKLETKWDEHHHIHVHFAVKPADLSDPYWERNPPDDDGWVVFRDDLTLSMRLDEDGMWRCDWIM